MTIHPIAPRTAPALELQQLPPAEVLDPPPLFALLEARIAFMQAINAGHMELRIGSRRRPRFCLRFKKCKGETTITNKLTGTVARAGDAPSVEALLQECAPGLLFYESSVAGLLPALGEAADEITEPAAPAARRLQGPRR